MIRSSRVTGAPFACFRTLATQSQRGGDPGKLDHRFLAQLTAWHHSAPPYEEPPCLTRAGTRELDQDRGAARPSCVVEGLVPQHFPEVAVGTGVAPSALRYYEELGLMPPAARTSGQRRYDDSAVELVGTILLLRDVGFSLNEVKALTASRSQSDHAWRGLVRTKLAALDQQIARAEVARIALGHALSCQHEELPHCPNFARVVAGRVAGKSLQEAHSH